jgi:hypothetical protein
MQGCGAMNTALQVNVRFNASDAARIARNARLLGVKKTDYIRGLVAKDGDVVTGAEAVRRSREWLRKNKNFTPV